MPLFALLGLALAVFVLRDVAITTVAVGSGGGPFTRRWTGLAWRAALALGHRRRAHRFLRTTGIAIVLTVPLAWIVLTWIAWSLVFSSDDGGVVSTISGDPAGVMDRAYYAGYTLLTLGNGDFRPVGALWQVATIAATGNGLVLVTLGVTYLVPVTSAAARRRRVAAYLMSLGSEPQELLRHAWDGRRFVGLTDSLRAVTTEILDLEQSQLTYPILHYFHSEQRRSAVSVAIAVLDDALLLLCEGVADEARPHPMLLEPPVDAIGGLLDTVGAAYVRPSREMPPPPDLQALRDAGIPVVADPVFSAAVAERAARRRVLRGMVEHDGWHWDVVSDRRADAALSVGGRAR